MQRKPLELPQNAPLASRAALWDREYGVTPHAAKAGSGWICGKEEGGVEPQDLEDTCRIFAVFEILRFEGSETRSARANKITADAGNGGWPRRFTGSRTGGVPRG
jgi:hypothetical protein